MKADKEQVYAFIQKFADKNNSPPTAEEISKKFGWEGKSVYYILNQLIADGLIVKTKGAVYRLKKVK